MGSAPTLSVISGNLCAKLRFRAIFAGERVDPPTVESTPSVSVVVRSQALQLNLNARLRAHFALHLSATRRLCKVITYGQRHRLVVLGVELPRVVTRQFAGRGRASRPGTWTRMKYLIASLFGALLLFGSIAFAGSGHGWTAGAYSCLPLAPITFAAWLNALGIKPSLHIAIGLLTVAGVVLAGTAYATLTEGTNYFYNYWRLQGPIAGPLLALIYFSWVFACGLPWWRRRAET